MTYTMMPNSGTQPGLVRVAIGYVVAVALACMVVLVLLCMITKVAPDSSFFGVFLLGCMFTFGYGLPGFIATVLICRFLNQQKQVFFIVAGGLNGALSLAIFDLWVPNGPFFLMVVAGGLAGGLVYWLIAYRLHRAAA